jgi:DNA-binding LacI/PurR family transcriptional regulator
MSDVAKLTGVSPQTVSRVVNGAPYVSEITRRRVLEAMQELGYHPNSAARSLAQSRSHNIGIISIESLLYGPSTLLRFIEGAADAAGYSISVVHLRDLSKRGTEDACRRFADQSADGVILIEPVHAASKFFQSLGVPLVALGRSSTRGIPSVSNDNAGDASNLVEYLLSLGHETVWHIAGPAGWTAADQRIKGWQAALERAGRPVPDYARGDWTPRSGYDLGLQLAKNRDVSAIFVANDHMAVGVLGALAASGRRVPEDVSVAGFDDSPEAEFLIPSLTTMRVNFDAVATTALDMLVKMIESGPLPSAHTEVASLMMVRSSTCRRGASGPVTIQTTGTRRTRVAKPQLHYAIVHAADTTGKELDV